MDNQFRTSLWAVLSIAALISCFVARGEEGVGERLAADPQNVIIEATVSQKYMQIAISAPPDQEGVAVKCRMTHGFELSNPVLLHGPKDFSIPRTLSVLFVSANDVRTQHGMNITETSDLSPGLQELTKPTRLVLVVHLSDQANERDGELKKIGGGDQIQCDVESLTVLPAKQEGKTGDKSGK